MPTTTLYHWLRLVAVAATATLASAACAQNPTSAHDTGPDLAAYNDADIAFLNDMTPHHRQAVEMAEMVPERTDRPELNQLAENIITSQNAEIEQMTAMLADAGEEPPAENGDMPMPGMTNEADIQEIWALPMNSSTSCSPR